MRMNSAPSEDSSAFLNILERMECIERRLDNRIKLRYNANVAESEHIFMEFNLQKRPQGYMVASTDESFHITRDDLDQIKSAVKAVLQGTVSTCQMDCTVYRMDYKNIFDLHVKISGVASFPLKKSSKCSIYESIESSIEVNIGDVFTITPVYNNRHLGFVHYDKFVTRVL